MMNPILKEKILHQIEILPDDLQQKILDFSLSLAKNYQQGVDGRELLKFSGTFEESDLKTMENAIKDGCDKVDINEW